MRPNEMYNAEGIIIVWYASTRATSIPSRAHYSGREIPADVSGKVHEEQSWKLPSPRGRYHGFKLSRRGERGSSWNCWLHFVSPPCRSSPCFKQATPPFTGVSNHYLAVHHLHYRILIILDIDSIPLSFPLFSLLRFVKFSNEQFYWIWLYRDYYWLFLILSDWFNTWICTFEYSSNTCCDVDGVLDSFLIHFSTYYYYKVWWVKFRCE